MQKFIIISTQRSGSSLLVTTLASHPAVVCHREIFLEENFHPNSYSTFRVSSLRNRVAHLFYREKLVNQYLEKLLSEAGDVAAFGFKFMYSQDKPLPQVIEWAEREDVKVIHLIRANVLKKRLSRLVSRFRNLAHSTERVEVCRISIETTQLKEKLDSMSEQIDQFRSRLSHLQYIEVTYEELVANQAHEIKRLLEFLELEVVMGLSSNLVKVNSNDLSEVIKNYDEVAQVLTGTKYEQFLQ
jgi:LPS sulfotransferase NodH